MGPDVFFEITSCYAREIALITLKGLFSSVFSLVDFQTASFNATIIACITLEQLFS